jgi:hypothetical protein
MRQHRERNAPSSEFGRMLTRVLIARDLNNDDLRRRLAGEGRPLSKQFIGFLCNGRRDPSVGLIGAVARVLDLTEDWTQRLYRAAAIDRGYRIGAVE